MIKEKFVMIIEKIKNSNTKQKIIAGGSVLGVAVVIAGVIVGLNLHSQKVANGGLTDKQLKKAVAAEQKATGAVTVEEANENAKKLVESKTASLTEEEKKEVEKKVEESGVNPENAIEVNEIINEVKPQPVQETPKQEETQPVQETPKVSEPETPKQEQPAPAPEPEQPKQETPKPEPAPAPEPTPEPPKQNNPAAGTYNAEMSSWLNQVLIDNAFEYENVYGMNKFIPAIDRGEIPAAGTITIDPISKRMNGPTAVVGPYYFSTKTEDSQYWEEVFDSTLYHDAIYGHTVRVRVFNDGNGGWYVNAYYLTTPDGK